MFVHSVHTNTTTTTTTTMTDNNHLPFRILSYNVWLMPPIVSCPAKTFACLDVSPRKKTRAQAIALSLPVDNVDVIVLCEAFCDTSVDILCEGLQNRGFAYRTKTLGDDWYKIFQGKLISGGVVVVSRYPFENVEELWFGKLCARDDGLANKGCIRVSVRMPGDKLVHIFATHTQAWNEPNCIEARRQQLSAITQWIQSCTTTNNIINPITDVVLVAGDMNIDRNLEDGIHYRDMLERLHCVDFASASEPPSFNHIKNVLASSGPSSGGVSELLDYVLASKDHRIPTQGVCHVIELTTKTPYTYNNKELIDLSDHYPVMCEMMI